MTMGPLAKEIRRQLEDQKEELRECVEEDDLRFCLVSIELDIADVERLLGFLGGTVLEGSE